jgi:hypothetical protein
MQRTGRCKYGDACYFDHVGLSSSHLFPLVAPFPVQCIAETLMIESTTALPEGENNFMPQHLENKEGESGEEP